jgi:hypothetical protein
LGKYVKNSDPKISISHKALGNSVRERETFVSSDNFGHVIVIEVLRIGGVHQGKSDILWGLKRTILKHFE